MFECLSHVHQELNPHSKAKAQIQSMFIVTQLRSLIFAKEKLGKFLTKHSGNV